MSNSLTDYLAGELQTIPEQYITSTIQGLVYASQVLINLQLQARPEQAPHILMAVNRLNPILSGVTAINTLIDMASLYNEPNGRNAFKLAVSTANIFDIPSMGFRIFADTIYDVIDGEKEEILESLSTVGVPVGLFSLILYKASIPVMLVCATFVGTYSYYNTGMTLYQKSEKIRYDSLNQVSHKFFAWAAPQEELAIKAINPAAEINNGSMIFNNGYKLYCLEAKADSNSSSAGQYFCYELMRGFSLVSANNYAQLIAERIIVEKETGLKAALTNNKTRLDLYHKPMYRVESLNLEDELDKDQLVSNALQYWCYDSHGKRELGHYTKFDNKAIGVARKHVVEEMFAISKIQISRVWPEGKNCLEIKVSLNDQYCDCECLENKGENLFKTWCSDAENQSLPGSTTSDHSAGADGDL
jgi:hypothetical protein